MDGDTQGDRPVAPPQGSRSARPDDKWSAELTRSIGEQLRYWRRRRKLTVRELSDKTQEVGQRIPATVLTNIEHGRRDYVSVSELLLIGAALNVPPVLLVAPIGRTSTIESLPDAEISPWRTRGWLMGAIPPIFEGFNLQQWNDAVTSIRLYDTHRLLVRSYQEAARGLKELDDDRMDVYPGRQWPQDVLDRRTSFRRVLLSQLAAYLEQLRTHRREMRDMGFIPPALPPEVQADLTHPPIGQPDEHGSQ